MIVSALFSAPCILIRSIVSIICLLISPRSYLRGGGGGKDLTRSHDHHDKIRPRIWLYKACQCKLLLSLFFLVVLSNSINSEFLILSGNSCGFTDRLPQYSIREQIEIQ